MENFSGRHKISKFTQEKKMNISVYIKEIEYVHSHIFFKTFHNKNFTNEFLSNIHLKDNQDHPIQTLRKNQEEVIISYSF